MTELPPLEQIENSGVAKHFPPAPSNFGDAPLNRLRMINAAELQQKVFPPVSYVIPGYIAEGLTLFAGRPKLGKSWACLDWACAVASGGKAFGDIECETGDVLYLALEDNQRRLQHRLKKILPECKWPDRLSLMTHSERLDKGGLSDLVEWISQASKPRLIIIDVLARVKPENQQKGSHYDADYAALKGLHDLASKHQGLAIVVVTHVRKMDAEDPLDTVSGTLGFAGAADSVLILNRSGQGVTLYGRGRDIEEIETAVEFDKDVCRWRVLGNATEVRRSDERKAIIEALSNVSEPIGPSEIAEDAGMKAENVKVLLRKMVTDGEVKKEGRGKYTSVIPVTPVTSVTSVTSDNLGWDI